MTFYTIPPKSRPEWKKMITGEISHSFRNYVLQIQIHQLRKEIKLKLITTDQAVDRLYALCLKFALAVQTDFKTVFKEW